MKSLLIVACLLTSFSLKAQDTLRNKRILKTYPATDEVEENKASNTPSKNLHIDLMAGTATPSGGNVKGLKTRLGVGAQVLANATPDFLIGAFLTTNNGEIKSDSRAEFRMTYYGLVTQYKFNETFFFQGRAGLSSLKLSLNAPSLSASIKANENPFIASAGFGAEFPINEVASFAPFASFTHSFKAGSGDDEVLAYNLIEVVAALRFNF